MPQSNASFGFCQELLARTRQIVFSFDIASNQFSYLNPAFETVFHKTRESVATPAALLDMLNPEDQPYLQEKYAELLDGVILKDIEFRIELPGEVRWLCLTPFLVEKAGQQTVVGFAEDISAVKEYATYMRRYTDKKNAVLNIISHDLAGPLGMIQNLTALLAEELQHKESEDIKNLISLIERTSKQGSKLIQEFITQEFLESTNTDMRKQRIDIVQMTRSVMKQYYESASRINKVFELHTSADSILMELDENKFMQAINNLISNAIKFTPDGGIITVSVEEEEEAVLFKVADDGIGIPERFHATLFDKFTNARRPGIKGEPSIGLGMSIVQTIVEWHHGRIWFESEENKGTTFYISLPKSTILPASL